MSELPLDDQQRYTLARHLDRVRVAQLMWREATAHSSASSRSVQLSSHAGRCPWPTLSRAAKHTEKRADRQLGSQLKPRRELTPRPSVHADLAALAALAPSHQDCASDGVKVALAQRERFVGQPARAR